VSSLPLPLALESRRFVVLSSASGSDRPADCSWNQLGTVDVEGQVTLGTRSKRCGCCWPHRLRGFFKWCYINGLLWQLL